MSEYRYKTEDLASELDCSPKTVRRKAAVLSIGIDLGGRAGYRYSEADRLKLIDSMKPQSEESPRRKRRSSRRAA